MNAQRRKAIAALADQVEELQRGIRALAEEEQNYYDNMPESIQGGAKGDAAQSAADYLEEAADTLDDAVASLNGAQE